MDLSFLRAKYQYTELGDKCIVLITGCKKKKKIILNQPQALPNADNAYAHIPRHMIEHNVYGFESL